MAKPSSQKTAKAASEKVQDKTQSYKALSSEKSDKSVTSSSKGEVEIDIERLLMPLAIVIASIIISVPISLSLYFGLRDAGIGGSGNVKGVVEAAACDSADPFSDDCLIGYADEVGLDADEFQQCYENEDFNGHVDDDLSYGQEIGVGGTPTLLIGENKGGDSMEGFLLSAGVTKAQLESLTDDIKSDGIEKAAKVWVDSQLDSLDSYETQLRDFYVQQGQSGDTLQGSIDAGLSQRKSEIETEGGVSTYELGDNHYGRGDDGSDVVVMEFSDFECPFCQRFAQGEVGTYIADEADSGNIYFVYRDFPLESIHPKARSAANAARCAGEQGKYFEYHDSLLGVEN